MLFVQEFCHCTGYCDFTKGPEIVDGAVVFSFLQKKCSCLWATLNVRGCEWL